MMPNRLSLLSAVVAVLVSAPVAPADEGEAKPIRRPWFPRFSPDGKLVLAAHGSWEQKDAGEALLLSAKDGAVLHAFPHPRGVRSVAWLPDGTSFLTSGYGQPIRCFEIKGYKERFRFVGNRNVDNVRVTSDGKLIAASFGNGDIGLYEFASRKQTHLFKGAHNGGIWGMALAPNDTLLASAGKDGSVNVFDLRALKKVHHLKHPAKVNGVAFTPDNRYLATGCGDAKVRIFDASTGERVAVLEGHKQGSVPDLQFSSDGKLLASAGMDGTVRLWDVSDLKNPTEKRALQAHEDFVFGVAISPDDRRLVSAGWDEQIKLWDLTTGDVVWTWKRD